MVSNSKRIKMSTLLSSSPRVKLLVVLALAASVFLVACGAQAAAGPVNTEVPSATAMPAVATNVVVPGQTSAPAAASQVSFSKDVLPILQSRCVSCHGGEKTSNGLKMTSYAELMAGSKNGPVVVASDANSSVMIKAILAGKMPKRGPKLLPDQIQVLVDWINGGALNN
jgi:uncharacterized membrane protein